MRAASFEAAGGTKSINITAGVCLGRPLVGEAPEVRSGTPPMAETQAASEHRSTGNSKRSRGRSKSGFGCQVLFSGAISVQSQRMPESSGLFRCLSKHSSRRPLLRYGLAISLREEAVLELDVVGREPQRSYRRQTSSTQRQAQITGVRGRVCVR